MDILEVIDNFSKDTNIYFYDVKQYDNTDAIIAKSVFLDFYFGPLNVEIVASYILPGPILKEYLETTLPYSIEIAYSEDNYYDILVETMTDIYKKCITCEYHDLEQNS